MKILLLGANGQVGWQLRRSLSVLGEVTALHRGSSPLCGDLTQPEALAQAIRAVAPDVVVNAAAYTAVDRAETERDAAFAVNAGACEVLAAEAARLGAWLVHYSTDYVYDGTGQRPWRESDATAPINVYGASKLAGEQAVARHERHVILRTCWVFDTWGQNFLKSILRAAAQRDSLSIVCDQWGAPTRAALIADVTAHVVARLRPELAGIYHVAAAGETNWHAYASLALEHAAQCGMPARIQVGNIRAIPSGEYPVAAARPANSRLDTHKLQSSFGLVLPPWQDGVRAVVAELASFNLSG
ncbi:dTDP-4-dehydrorhamnose reductase [Ramlibacter sp. RBP-2]|uniref:dTDP-4-dehydrorhamnose reductase n=1 Tax=Ramlibacter lithotrophicus TaxID=2606681 RepID=A0A7X6I6S0_9BURK|nr:dTDP-4-dehydrorhamnose reductase [Ramlibacter lithotrophicus]NKE66399.1 dTDP-4-dehydrorhamnose reductase [Ramlibacter lithotrophicus]